MKVYIRSADFTVQIPSSPGVYKYFDTEGVILYVGKAKNLKKRVSSYFMKKHLDAKTQVLVKKITITWGFSAAQSCCLCNSFSQQNQGKMSKSFNWKCRKKAQTLNRLKYRISLKC